MKFTKRKKIIGAVGLGILTLIIATTLYLRQEKIRVALEFGHLAKLPGNSSNVKVETKGSMFSRTFWLTFESTPEGIDQWVKDSRLSAMQDKEMQVGGHPKIMIKDPVTGETKELTKPRKSGLPDWFVPDESSATVDIYKVTFEDEALRGTIWIDRKQNKVYIETSYS